MRRSTKVLTVCMLAVLLIPIIPSISADDVYVNTGNYYYSQDGGDHEISVTVNGDYAVIDTDGYTQRVKMDRYWLIPLMIYINEDTNLVDSFYIECVTDYPDVTATVFVRSISVLNVSSVVDSHSPLTITIDADGTDKWYAYVGSQFIRAGSLFPMMYISETGNHVLSDKPVVKQNTEMYVFGGTEIRNGTPQNGLCGRASYFTHGVLTDLRANTTELGTGYLTRFMYENEGTELPTEYSYDVAEDSYNISPVRTADSRYGIRFNGLTVGVVWTNYLLGDVPMKVYLTNAIVPTEMESESSDPDIFTNTGKYHYDMVTDDVIQHITVSVENDVCIIHSSYGWEKRLTMNTYWTVPLFTTSSDVWFLECMPYIPAIGTNTFQYGIRLLPGDTDLTTNGTAYDIEIYGDRNIYVYRDEATYLTGTVDMLMSESDGEYVYAYRPTVKENSRIYLVGGMCRTIGTPRDGWYICGSEYTSIGTIGHLKDNLQNVSAGENYIKVLHRNAVSDPSNIQHVYTMVQDSQTISDVNTSENSYGYVMNGIDTTSKWAYGNDMQFMKFSLDSAIVPVEVVASSGDSDDENGYNPVPSENLWIMFAIGIPAVILVGLVLIFKR